MTQAAEVQMNQNQSDSTVSEQEFVVHGLQDLLRNTDTRVQRDEQSVSFSGISLPRREDQEGVPELERFMDHIITDYDAELQRKIAIALDLKQPILIQGGSGIGKTATVERMAALLGWSCHYANCSKYDAKTLIGADRTDESTKSGFGWKDGIVLNAIRKGGVLILDEYNFMKAETQGRLHEILDAVLNGKKHITLTENGGERVEVHENFRLVVLQNPPGSGYQGRTKLDRANFTRFAHFEEPEELPHEILHARTIGAVRGSAELSKLEDMENLMSQFQEFHRSVKELYAQGDIGKDQAQPVHFSYPRDLKRVIAYMERYSTGNPVENLHQALEYYYVARFYSQEDKERIRELVRLIDVSVDDDPERVILEEQDSREKTTSASKSPQASQKASTNNTHYRPDFSTDDPVEYYRALERNNMNVPQVLAGDGSQEAWDIREQYLNSYGYTSELLHSLAGLDCEQSFHYRQRALVEALGHSHKLSMSDFFYSLAGVTGEEADGMRKKLLDHSMFQRKIKYLFRGGEFNPPGTPDEILRQIVSPDSVYRAAATSLIGQNSKEANEMKESLGHYLSGALGQIHRMCGLESPIGPGGMFLSLFTAGAFTLGVGLYGAYHARRAHSTFKAMADQPLPAAKLHKYPLDIALALSVGGRDDLHWGLRELAYQTSSDYYAPLARSLCGLECDKSKDFRERILSSRGLNMDTLNAVAESLAGLETPWAEGMRNRIWDRLKGSKQSTAVTPLFRTPLSITSRLR